MRVVGGAVTPALAEQVVVGEQRVDEVDDRDHVGLAVDLDLAGQLRCRRSSRPSSAPMRSAIAPCLAKSLTQAPSRPTTSGMVPDAAPATSCSLVEAYGPLSSLTLMPGFSASKSSMIVAERAVGQLGLPPLRELEGDRAAAPPEVELEPESDEPHATRPTPTMAAAATSPSLPQTALRGPRLRPPAVISHSFVQRLPLLAVLRDVNSVVAA